MSVMSMTMVAVAVVLLAMVSGASHVSQHDVCRGSHDYQSNNKRKTRGVDNDDHFPINCPSPSLVNHRRTNLAHGLHSVPQ